MRVVSSQTEADIKRRETAEALTLPLRELAANVMRLAKHGGHPLRLLPQLEACLGVLQNYVAAHRYLPDTQLIHDIFDCDLALTQHRPWLAERRREMAEFTGERDTASSDREEAMQLIRHGALQVAASMLVNQLPQQRMGEQDISTGIRLMQQARTKQLQHRTDPKKLATFLAKMTASKRGNRKKKPSI